MVGGCGQEKDNGVLYIGGVASKATSLKPEEWV